jgi:hypothetical protein
MGGNRDGKKWIIIIWIWVWTRVDLSIPSPVAGLATMKPPSHRRGCIRRRCADMSPEARTTGWRVLGNSGKPVTLGTLSLTKFSKYVFQEAGNSRLSRAWNLWSLEFTNVLSSGILIRQRGEVASVRKPGISTNDSPNFGEPPIRESDEDPVRGSGAWTSTNQRGSKDQFGNLLKI